MVVGAAGPADAPPIALVHGHSQSWLSWREQFESDLTVDHRLIAPDRRGHGDSEKPKGSDRYRDPERWAADVRAVIDELTREKSVLVGWSYGGLVLSDYLAVAGTDDVAVVNFVGAISERGTDAAAAVADEAFAAMLGRLEMCDAEESVAALAAYTERFVEGTVDDATADRLRQWYSDATLVGVGQLARLSLGLARQLDALVVDTERPFVGWGLENRR